MQTENPAYRPDGNSVAIFVDFENIEISYENKSNRDSEVDWSKVLDIAVQYGRALSQSEIKQLSSVPLPAAGWLLASGAVGLIALRRKLRS